MWVFYISPSEPLALYRPGNSACIQQHSWYGGRGAVKYCGRGPRVLKALCHASAISADCLLIEAARAHAVNEHWAWRIADKFACTFKSAR